MRLVSLKNSLKYCKGKEVIGRSLNLFSTPYLSCNYHDLSKGSKNTNIFCSSNKNFKTFRRHLTLRNGPPISMAYTSFKQTSPERISLPPIIIMHGLLGSKQNWKTLGKLISEKTGRTVYTVDARNHGESSHTNEFNYYILGEDILYFLQEHSIPKACLMGHSMGGRAVMTVALHNPSVIEKLFVLDISPVGTAEAISSTPIFIETMRGVTIPDNLELHEARKMVDKLLLPIISEEGIRMFLLQNLVKKEKEFTWRANLDAIAKNFNDNIAGFPPAKDGKPFHGETYFIGGALSDYLKPSDHDEIRLLFPNVKFSYIEGAGHWLHAEKPKEFLQEITTLLRPSDHDEIRLLFPNVKFSYIEGAGHWLHAEKPKEFLQEITTLLRPSDHDEIRLLFPNVKFSYIEGAGHWLHAEKPKEFLQEITTLLR